MGRYLWVGIPIWVFVGSSNSRVLQPPSRIERGPSRSAQVQAAQLLARVDGLQLRGDGILFNAALQGPWEVTELPRGHPRVVVWLIVVCLLPSSGSWHPWAGPTSTLWESLRDGPGTKNHISSDPRGWHSGTFIEADFGRADLPSTSMGRSC